MKQDPNITGEFDDDLAPGAPESIPFDDTEPEMLQMSADDLELDFAIKGTYVRVFIGGKDMDRDRALEVLARFVDEERGEDASQQGELSLTQPNKRKYTRRAPVSSNGASTHAPTG